LAALAILSFVVLSGVVNALIPPMTRWIAPGDPAAFLVFASVGVIIAQAALLAGWFVFAPVFWANKLGSGAFIALFWLCGWFMGFAIVNVDPARSVELLVCVPLFLLSMQAPLWAARFWLRWRVVPRTAACRTFDRPMQLSDLLIAITCFAFALAAARIAAPADSNQDSDFFVALVTGSGAAALTGLVAILPLLIVTLKLKRLWLFLPVPLVIDIAAIHAVVAITEVISNSPAPREAYIDTAIVAVSYFVATAGVLLALRWSGYRLMWVAKQLW
jgi:hypothetical protein